MINFLIFIGVILALLLMFVIIFSVIHTGFSVVTKFKVLKSKLLLPSFVTLIIISLFVFNSYLIIDSISNKDAITTLMQIVFNTISTDIVIFEILVPIAITFFIAILIQSFSFLLYNINYSKLQKELNKKYKKDKKQKNKKDKKDSTSKIDIITANEELITSDKTIVYNLPTTETLNKKVSYAQCIIATIFIAITTICVCSISFLIGMIISSNISL